MTGVSGERPETEQLREEMAHTIFWNSHKGSHATADALLNGPLAGLQRAADFLNSLGKSEREQSAPDTPEAILTRIPQYVEVVAERDAALAAVADAVDKALRPIEELRRQHVEVGSEVLGDDVRLCWYDGLRWPCKHSRDLDAAIAAARAASPEGER